MKLYGTLSPIGHLSGKISVKQTLSGIITIPRETKGTDYEGPYVVSPKAYVQTVLDTKDKHMVDDVTVLEIPYAETSNESDGLTIFIGKEVMQIG